MNSEDTRVNTGKRIARNAAAVFLIVIILLTFFSKTINNYLLPEVECRSPWNGYLQYEVKAPGSVKATTETKKILAQGNWNITDVVASEDDTVQKGAVLAVVDTEAANLDIQKAEFDLLKLKDDLQTYMDTYKGTDIRSYEDEVLKAKKAVDDEKINFEIVLSLSTQNPDAQTAAGSEMQLRVNQESQKYEGLKNDYAEKQRLLDQKRAEALVEEDIYKRTISEKQTTIDLKSRDVEAMKKLLPPGNQITAPEDCMIKAVHIEPGQTCAGQQTLFEYMPGGSKLTIEWMLNSAKAELLGEGDSVDFNIKGNASLSWEGKVDRKEFSPKDGMYRYSAEIPADGDQLAEGMEMEVKASESSSEYPLIVPKSALSKQDNRDCVFVVRERQGALGVENYVESVNVSVMETDDLNAAITGDLKPEDKIVTLTTKALGRNVAVKLR